MVIAPANTGKERSSSIDVIRMDHINRGICSILMLEFFMFKIVTIKLIDETIDEIPAM